MTSQDTYQVRERIFPVYDNWDDIDQYIKELVWKVGPYQLVVRYFSEDENDFSNGDHNIRIKNNSKFKVDLIPMRNDFISKRNAEHGESIYTGVEVSMFSNLAETPEELEELSEVLKDTAKAQRVFTDVLKELF